MLRLSFALAILGFAVSAEAQDLRYYSNEGDVYIAAFNENGAVLTSLYPKTFAHLGKAEDHTIIEAPAALYFGVNCDALHSALGEGEWSGGNGAFGANFGGHVISFNGQELDSMRFPKCYPGAG